MRLSKSAIRRLQTQLGLHECSFERLNDFARAIETEAAERCAKVCTTFDVCDPKHIADAIRAAYKETT